MMTETLRSRKLINEKRKFIKAVLKQHFPNLEYDYKDGISMLEVEGETSHKFVERLKSLGADISVYRHKGTVATVIKF